MRPSEHRLPTTEVITVSAFTDSDGEPGKAGASTPCVGRDDTFAKFSNFGRDIDIAAPGVCILSTVPVSIDPDKDGYDENTGTSMATPHVTGAIALYIDRVPVPTCRTGFVPGSWTRGFASSVLPLWIHRGSGHL